MRLAFCKSASRRTAFLKCRPVKYGSFQGCAPKACLREVRLEKVNAAGVDIGPIYVSKVTFLKVATLSQGRFPEFRRSFSRLEANA